MWRYLIPEKCCVTTECNECVELDKVCADCLSEGYQNKKFHLQACDYCMSKQNKVHQIDSSSFRN